MGFWLRVLVCAFVIGPVGVLLIPHGLTDDEASLWGVGSAMAGILLGGVWALIYETRKQRRAMSEANAQVLAKLNAHASLMRF